MSLETDNKKDTGSYSFKVDRCTLNVSKPPRRKYGFELMSEEKRKIIASKGGKAAHASGNAYRWNSEAAKIAGRKGGSISRRGKGKKNVEG